MKNEDLKLLSQKTEGMSGRNISDICKGNTINYSDAERRWASKLIRKEVEQELPDS